MQNFMRIEFYFGSQITCFFLDALGFSRIFFAFFKNKILFFSFDLLMEPHFFWLDT